MINWNFAFGVPEYIVLKVWKYDPKMGVGFDVISSLKEKVLELNIELKRKVYLSL